MPLESKREAGQRQEGEASNGCHFHSNSIDRAESRRAGMQCRCEWKHKVLIHIAQPFLYVLVCIIVQFDMFACISDVFPCVITYVSMHFQCVFIHILALCIK